MPTLEIRDIAVDFALQDSAVHALRDVSLEIDEGEFFVLLGPSGCGKTTMLRSIAGLERPSSGQILIDGIPVFSSRDGVFVAPHQRPIAMVFQSYAIWPHMDVFENVAFPLRRGRTKLDEKSVRHRVTEMLELLGLEEMANRPVTTLSGGQQQRVALARALALRPRVLLMDEPLSNLDFKLQVRLRAQMRDLMHRLNLTTVHVTHNQSEALETGDRIAVMDLGRIIQIADPQTIYRRPETDFVARFIGEMNLLHGRVRKISGEVAEVDTRFGLLSTLAPPSGALSAGMECFVGVRPEDLTVVENGSAETRNIVSGTVTAAQFVGEALVYTIEAGDEELRIKQHQRRNIAVGDPIRVEMPLEQTISVVPGAGSAAYSEDDLSIRAVEAGGGDLTRTVSDAE